MRLNFRKFFADLGRWLAHHADCTLRQLLDDHALTAPPRDVPTTGWSSEAGDRIIGRVVAGILAGVLFLLLLAQTCLFAARKHRALPNGRPGLVQIHQR